MGLFTNTGAIANCAQCMNKAEVRIYPNDNPQAICEDCYKDNQKLEQKIATKAEAVSLNNAVDFKTDNTPLLQSYSGLERDKYIDIICRMASDEWVKKFTSHIKRALVNDWQTIIRNERWFSLLELRRFALQLDPDMDKQKPKQQGFTLIEENSPQPIVRIRKKRKAKEPKDA